MNESVVPVMIDAMFRQIGPAEIIVTLFALTVIGTVVAVAVAVGIRLARRR